MKSTKILQFVIPVFIALAVFAAFLALKRNDDSPVDNDDEYQIYDRQTVRLVVGSRLISMRNPPIIKDNEIAIDLDTVKRYIDKTVNWDAANKKVTITTRDRLVRMNTDNLTAFVNDRQEVKLDLPVFEEGGVVYLPMKFLSEYFQIRVSYEATNKVVIVDDRRAVVQTATVVESGAVMRLGRDTGEPIVKRFADPAASSADVNTSGVATDGISNDGGDVPAEVGINIGVVETINTTTDNISIAGATDNATGNATGAANNYDGLSDIDDGDFDMYVFEEYSNWYRVRSLDGILGYIEKKYVAVRRYVDRLALTESKPTAWKPDNGKIMMVWEQVSSIRANPDTGAIPDMPGLDIVSPTWFNLTDRDGTVESRASTEYIEWAHRRGYKVWALFSNTMNDINMTSAFLNNSLARENAIRALLAYAAILDIDGINLDFENVYLADKDALTQFVRELSPMLREQGLTFSVDVNIPDGSDTWSKCYDTPAIADTADYVNLMAYDQFGARSTESGSVSQLSWVEYNLQKLIDRDGVPPEKILLGIPFYTRVWQMGNANAAPGDQPSDSSAVGMRTAIGGVFDNDGDIEWDEESGQFFCRYDKGGKTYHVWIEDPHSANMRSSLVHKYALAGVSAWSRNFVIPDIWDVLNRNLKEIISYYQWQTEAYIESPTLARPQ